MLTPDRWRRLETLFEDALDLPLAERAAFVSQQTTDDAALERELSGMLEHAPFGGSRIANVVSSVAQLSVPVTEWVDRRFGEYRIVREIGRGGMGLVFEAVRADDEYLKRVALKIAPWWRDAGLIGSRFRLERQILANLDHPNIARFLDGGTEDGLPYFVMEYVEGVPIAAYCERHSLNVRERVELVRQVCAAVHFAHQNLVVHRDIKPANILVDENGTPKLLDFGIAKFLDGAEGSLTTTGAGIWTPDYASPEQARGQAITTRADVYSLGLVLYELLTGERGQVADQSSPLALDRSICEVEPALPSERVLAQGARADARRLRGDLDTIVMTALRKEPDRRYGSAAALSDDLARYLNGQPILARPNTTAYRTLKFLRRHRLGVSAAALVVISLAAGLSAAIYEARRAERHFQQVRSLANTFVFDVHDSIERLPGATEARRAIVRTALTYLEALRADAGGDDALALELAEAYIKVGDVQGNPVAANLGDTAGAIVSFTRAKELLRPLADGGDRAAQLRIAVAGQKLANIQWAQDDRSGALAELLHAIQILEPAVVKEPSDREALTVLGEAYAARARFENTLGDFSGAARDGERAMQTARRLVELDPHNQDHQMNLSTAHNAVGGARMVAGELEGAADAFREAVAIRERLVTERPTDASYQRNLVIAYGNLGDVLGFRTGQNLGDPVGAAAAYEKAVRIAEAATRSDPADQRATFDLSSAKLRLGAALSDVPGQEARGLRVLEEAEQLNTTLAVQDAGSARYGYNALVIGLRLGGVLTRLDRAAEAARRYETVRADATRFLNGPNGANARVQLVLASARLATLRAMADDARAVPLADFVATELEKKPIGLPVVDAEAYGAAGRSYLRGAMRGTAGERDRLARAAMVALTKSAEQWRRAQLSKALDAHRTSELAAIDADIAVARKLVEA